MRRFSLVSLGLLVVAASLSGANGCCCPVDSLPMNGFCYHLNNEPKSWNDAEMFCRKFKPGCQLASIHSMEQSADLAQYISDYIKTERKVWIGLNDAQKKRVWTWTDRSCTDYLAWAPGEPNNQKGDEYCVELLPITGYMNWNDHPCKSLNAFICQCKY